MVKTDPIDEAHEAENEDEEELEDELIDEVEAGQADWDDTKDAVGNVGSALQSVSRVTDTAIFMSISFPHLQFISFSFVLPFGWPEWVEEFASYVVSVVSIDFGMLTSPECADLTDDPAQMFLGKFLMTHGCYVVINILLLFPKLTGHHRALHSTNAMIAVWCISLGPLIKSCIRTVDCTYQPQYIPPVYTLDAMPDISCWEALSGNEVFYVMVGMGAFGFLIYAVTIPLMLFKRLLRESKDEAEERFDPDFMESHGWLVLRYKPTRWWFEFPLCAFKMVVVCSSELLKTDAKALQLLYVLAGATALLLLLVMIDRPYRDSQGHEGATQADYLQMLVLTAQLLNYRVGYWCLITQREREAAGEPRNDTTKSWLSPTEEVVVALLAALFVLGPLLPPGIGWYMAHHRRKAVLIVCIQYPN